MINAMIGAYAKMIKDNLCTIHDIPYEYKDAVLNYTEEPSASPIVQTNEDSNEPYGALFLGKQDVYVNISDFDNDKYSINISTNSVFDGHLEKDQPMPENIEYSLRLVENTFRKFIHTPEVMIYTTNNGLTMEISGHLVNAISGVKLLRVDINVTSSNYEDMLQTIYLIAK